uniref:Ciliary microtubule inner protein 7 n=1 Tax=Salvator merianae TaxID=96440 RepID=A0A8D0DSR2_SALMN
YTQEYRKAAQPPPPDIFVKRMKETPSKHIFSKHDNRHAFPGSATYFESGLGRRRIEGSLPNTHNLIDWVPLKDELQRDRPLMSSYQSDFRSENKVPQLLIHHAQLQEQPLQRTPSTTYQTAITPESRNTGVPALFRQDLPSLFPRPAEEMLLPFATLGCTDWLREHGKNVGGVAFWSI